MAEEEKVDALNEIERHLVSIADGVPPSDAVQHAFDVINQARRKRIDTPNTRQRAERAAAKWFEKTQAQSQAVLGAELLADIIAAEFEK